MRQTHFDWLCIPKGRYNKPEVAQICAVIPGADIDDPKKYNRDILLFCQDNPQVQRFNNNDCGMTRINELHPGYDTAQYPIMLPHGSYTWKPHGYPLQHHVDDVDSDDAKEADSEDIGSVGSVGGDDEEDWAERSECEVDAMNGVDSELSLSEPEKVVDCDDCESESDDEVSDDDASSDEFDPRAISRCSVCALLFANAVAMIGSVDVENSKFSKLANC